MTCIDQHIVRKIKQFTLIKYLMTVNDGQISNFFLNKKFKKIIYKKV